VRLGSTFNAFPQFRVIQELLARPSATAFDVIFDDDGTG